MTRSNWFKVAIATGLAYAFSAQAANALPLVGVLGTLFTSLQATAIGGWLISTAVSFGASTLISKLFAKDVKEKGIRERMETGGDRPLSFIMGTYPTAGKLVYVNQVDDNIGDSGDNSYLVQVISLSELPVNALSSYVWINGEKCNIGTTANSIGFYDVAEYIHSSRSYCMIKFYDGTQTTPNTWLRAKFGDDPVKPWTVDMVGRGCAYVVVISRFSGKGYWAGIPQFKFVLQGIPLYDPRKDSSVGGSGSHRWATRSTWEYSANPKVMQYNIIRGNTYAGEWVWGGQTTSAYRLPLSYWTAAMDVCDENVTLAAGGTINRYEAGCEVTVDMQPLDVVKELDKCCAGFTTEYGGQYRTWCGQPGLSVMSFTDDDLIITEEQTDDLFKPLQETFNGARSTYIEPDEGWVSKDAAPRSNSAFVTEDGGYQLIADIDLPFVSEHNQVQRLALAAVNDSRRQRTHVVQMPPVAFQLEPFDVVTWTSTRNGYTNKKFMVVSIDDLPNCNQVVALREVDSTDYDWDTEYELPKTTGPLTQIKPGALALDFTAEADQVDSASGKDRPAIKVLWDWAIEDIDLSSIKYQIRRTGTTKVISAGTISAPDDEDNRTLAPSVLRFGVSYQIRLYAVPFRRGRDSAWTSWKTVVCTTLDVPTAPTLTRISDLADDGTLDFFVGIAWTAVSADVKYIVRIVSDGNTTKRVVDGTYYRIPATSGKTYVVSVATFGNDRSVGDYSSTASITVTKKNTAPTAPTSLTATGQNKRVKLTWNKSPDADFLRAIVYRSTTNNFTTASEVRRASATGVIDDDLANDTTYYYWVTFEDRSENESSKFPTSNTGGRSATTVYITGGDTDPNPPNVPTSISVTNLAADLDDDGTLDASLAVDWAAGAVDSTHPAATGYEYQIYRSASLGGSYTYWRTRSSGDESAYFEANATKYHKVRVRARSFAGVWSSWSSLSSTGVKPSVKTNTVATVTGVTAIARPKTNLVKWTRPTASDHDYCKIWRYAGASSTPGSATLIGSTKADRYIDSDDTLTQGTTYWYYVTAVDRSGNESASKSTGDSCSFKNVNYADTDETEPQDLQDTPVLAQAAKDVDGDGTVDIAGICTWDANSSQTTNVIVACQVSIYEAGALFDTRTTALRSVTFKAKVGKSYFTRIRTIGFNGVLSSGYKQSNTLTPTKKGNDVDTVTGVSAVARPKGILVKWTLPTAADHSHCNVWRYKGASTAPSSATFIAAIKGNRFVDLDQTLEDDAKYWYYVTAVDRSDNESASKSTGASVVFRAVITTDLAKSSISASSIITIKAGTYLQKPSLNWTSGILTKTDVLYLPANPGSTSDPNNKGVAIKNLNPAPVIIIGRVVASVTATSGKIAAQSSLSASFDVQLQARKLISGSSFTAWANVGNSYSASMGTMENNKQAKSFSLVATVADLNLPASGEVGGTYYYRMKVTVNHTRGGLGTTDFNAFKLAFSTSTIKMFWTTR